MTDVLTPTDDDAEVAAGESSAPARDLVAEGDAAADYLEGLLDIVDLDGDIDIDVEGDRAQVAIIEVNKGELGSLVGVDGKVMDALQDAGVLASDDVRVVRGITAAAFPCPAAERNTTVEVWQWI